MELEVETNGRAIPERNFKSSQVILWKHADATRRGCICSLMRISAALACNNLNHL